MRFANKKGVLVLLVVLPLTAMLFYRWNSNTIMTVDVLQGADSLKMLLEKRVQNMNHGYDHIPYHIKDGMSK